VIATLAAFLLALVVALSAWLAVSTGIVAVLGGVGLLLLAMRRPGVVGLAVVVLASAVGIALHDGAATAAAPLWGTGLLVAGGLAERAGTLPPAGEVEIAALVGWLAGLGALAGIGLAAAAIVLLAADANVGNSIAGVTAGALLAVIPALLARRLSARA
jgi:hypothetical protein